MSDFRSSPMTPVALTFGAALLWGLWWIPIRYLESLGLSGPQTGLLTNLGGVAGMGIYLVLRRQRPRIGRAALLGALFAGIAFTFYSVALALSEVVRVILLFYLAPTWSKIIEWAFLGHRWHRSSTVTLLVSLGGAFLVLGGEVSLHSIGLGDVVAVLSGLCWAIGTTLIFSGEKSDTVSLCLTTTCAAAVSALAFTWAVGDRLPVMDQVMPVLLGMVIGALYILPIFLVTLWSAQRLSPGVLNFLFTLEILAGVGSGALFLDEVFGLQQAVGAALIVSAALIEVFLALRKSRKPAVSA